MLSPRKISDCRDEEVEICALCLISLPDFSSLRKLTIWPFNQLFFGLLANLFDETACLVKLLQ